MLMLTTSLYATEKSEKKLSVKPFSVINVVGSLKVVYEQGSTYEVSLVGDAAAFDRIRVGSNGSDLNISKYGKVIGNVYVETSDSSDRRSVVVHVKAPDVRVFNMSGSGQIVVGKMKSTAVTFNQAGSGKIAVSQVVASHANFNNAGSGTILVDDVKADYVGLTILGGIGCCRCCACVCCFGTASRQYTVWSVVERAVGSASSSPCACRFYRRQHFCRTTAAYSRRQRETAARETAPAQVSSPLLAAASAEGVCG